jgi:cell division septum initiation protein DivIVA
MQYCSGVYENSFNSLLKSIERFRGVIQEEVDEI